MTRTVVDSYSNETNGHEPMKGWGQKRKGGVKFLNERRSKAPAPASTPGPAHAEAREPDSAPPTNTSELREAPSEGIFWAFHSSQIDEDNKFQPWSSAKVRQNIQGLLLGDRYVYREHFSIVSRMNPAIAAAVHDHTVSNRETHLQCAGGGKHRTGANRHKPARLAIFSDLADLYVSSKCLLSVF